MTARGVYFGIKAAVEDMFQSKSLDGLKVTWNSPNPASPATNAVLCLYQSDWDNPQPNKGVEQIDFVSRMTRSAPFLIAVTVE